jgi:ATP-dependent DNA ligase
VHWAGLQVTVQVCVFAFDALLVDGEPLVHLPLRQRRARLSQVVCCTP